jgi:hypothetical protein
VADRSASRWLADSTGQEADSTGQEVDSSSIGKLADNTTLPFLFRLLCFTLR